ncbi:MAG: alanine racemase [Clostridia bacterium]|nr:alanine racemase [Clostridia bacterium]
MSAYHRSFARIDLDAIRRNFYSLKSLLPPTVKVMAVVKADAYGHGSIPVARFLERDADWFAVACVDEGVTLRKGGIQKPILILGYTNPAEYPLLLEYDLATALFSEADGEALSRVAVEAGKKARIHLKVDTGMGRIGLPSDEKGVESAVRIARLPGILTEGLFSHYACADASDKKSAMEQKARFDLFSAALEKRGVSIPLKHLSNSAASMEEGFEPYDLCRFGIALYGHYPSDEVDKSRAVLCPAMTVCSHVSFVKRVPAGTPISYGHTYVADSERVLATVSIGYADGFPRSFSGGVGSVLIRGKRCRVVGRVCMDQIIVDATDLPEISVGDLVTVLGRDGKEEISAEEFGALSHSFPYEVLCSFMPRVTRIYEDF